MNKVVSAMIFLLTLCSIVASVAGDAALAWVFAAFPAGYAGGQALGELFLT